MSVRNHKRKDFAKGNARHFEQFPTMGMILPKTLLTWKEPEDVRLGREAEVAAITEPALRQSIPGGAVSWTPALA